MMPFSMISRLHNRRITLTRIDEGEGIVNCFKFRRLKGREIIHNHIHLSDEGLVAMINLRDEYHIEESKRGAI